MGRQENPVLKHSKSARPISLSEGTNQLFGTMNSVGESGTHTAVGYIASKEASTHA